MDNKNEGNWWEFYGIRYAQGTVVGAMIIYFLFSQNENLKRMLFIPADAKDFGVSHLILLAIYGLTYCYIASAPILVLHAGRGLFYKSKTNPNPSKGRLPRLATLVVLSLSTPAYYVVKYGADNVLSILSLSIYTCLLALQAIVLAGIFKFRWAETIAYFQAIVAKRVEYEGSGYVESYKHLREHGNSFFIVFLEFLLAIPIFMFVCQPGARNEDAIRHLFLIVFFWILPAAMIWAFGNKIESDLQNLPAPKPNKNTAKP